MIRCGVHLTTTRPHCNPLMDSCPAPVWQLPEPFRGGVYSLRTFTHHRTLCRPQLTLRPVDGHVRDADQALQLAAGGVPVLGMRFQPGQRLFQLACRFFRGL